MAVSGGDSGGDSETQQTSDFGKEGECVRKDSAEAWSEVEEDEKGDGVLCGEDGIKCLFYHIKAKESKK